MLWVADDLIRAGFDVGDGWRGNASLQPTELQDVKNGLVSDTIIDYKSVFGDEDEDMINVIDSLGQLSSITGHELAHYIRWLWRQPKFEVLIEVSTLIHMPLLAERNELVLLQNHIYYKRVSILEELRVHARKPAVLFLKFLAGELVKHATFPTASYLGRSSMFQKNVTWFDGR